MSSKDMRDANSANVDLLRASPGHRQTRGGHWRLTCTELDERGSPGREKQGEENGKAASGVDGGAERVTRVF